eukprot:gene17746-23184_t
MPQTKTSDGALPYPTIGCQQVESPESEGANFMGFGDWDSVNLPLDCLFYCF